MHAYFLHHLLFLITGNLKQGFAVTSGQWRFRRFVRWLRGFCEGWLVGHLRGIIWTLLLIFQKGRLVYYRKPLRQKWFRCVMQR